MINYDYSITKALNSSRSSSSINHHKRTNSVHLHQDQQQQQQQQQLSTLSSSSSSPYSFERKNSHGSQGSSMMSISDRSSIASPSSQPVTPQERRDREIILHQHQLPGGSGSDGSGSGSGGVGQQEQIIMSEPIIDLNKITEEYNNCQRKLSIASMKRANESLVHWCQFLQEEEDTRFYTQELNQNVIGRGNYSSSNTDLPVSSEILLERFTSNTDNDDDNNNNNNNNNNKKDFAVEGQEEHEEIDGCSNMHKKHHNQLMRTLSRITRKNSFSVIRSSRKSTASV